MFHGLTSDEREHSKHEYDQPRWRMGFVSVSFAPVILAVGVWTLLAASAALAQSPEKFRELRHKMVTECIEREGIRDPRVLAAMRTVPRHEFVKPGLVREAYHDTALPIGHQQTISPPFVVAYMTETTEHRVAKAGFEAGTAARVREERWEQARTERRARFRRDGAGSWD